MFHYFDTVTNTRGDSLAGWQVEVVDLADGETVVPIFADENSTPIVSVSGVANRAVSDAQGNYDFYVPSGTYSLNFYDDAGAFQRQQRYLSMYGADAANTANLASTSGATLVGESGGNTVQNVLTRTQSGTYRARNVSDILNPFADASGLSDVVVLKKLRADYGECAAYRNSTPDGLTWDRFLFSQRFNSGLDGLARHLLTSVAGLYTRTDIARATANNTTETRGSATTATYASSTGTTVGTWTGPATVLTTTDVIYSSTVGDTITFTVTGVERIELRALLAGNGGIGKVTITESAVEIPEANYLLPADHLVNFISTATGNTTMHFPLAEGLNSASTYDVEIEVDASNPSGNRVYTAGLLGFDDIAFDAVGTHGIVLDASLAGATRSMAIASGTRIVKQATNATKIDWRYVQTSVGSNATLIVYDSVGNQVSTLTFDQYASGSTLLKKEADRDLTKGTYYLHIINGKTKNASATSYRIYDAGAYAYDQTTAATPGTDPFDDNDVPDNIVDPNQGSDWVLIDQGNIEQATRINKTTETSADRAYVGGIHGHETLVSVVYAVDGSTVDYAGASVGDTFTGQREIKITTTTTLGFPSDDSAWATCVTEQKITKFGLSVKVTITTTAACTAYDDFGAMLIGPNTQTGGGTYGDNQGGNTGGGFEFVAMGGNYQLTSYDDSGTVVDEPGRSMAIANDEWAVVCTYTTTPTVPDLFLTDEFQAAGLGLWQDRIDNKVKGYIRTFSVGSNGETIPAASSWTTTKHYRTFKGDFKPLLGIG